MIAREPLSYLFAAALLLLGAVLVFGKVVREQYLRRGALSWPVSLLQLLIFACLISFPSLYNPPQWPSFWLLRAMPNPRLAYLGFFLILTGLLLAFGTMIWFGMRRAFGLQSSGLVQTGLYRWSRNPQILGGYLMVLGVALQWPSLHALGWVALYGAISHMMIRSEEAYLQQQFGDTYSQYCARVPRYLWFWGRERQPAAGSP